MRFLPFENFYITTSLKPDEVQERLRQEVEPVQGFSFKNIFSASSGAYFSGYVAIGAFEFKRLIYYRNSFLPVIKGTTETWLNGSRVHVKMRMEIAVIVFMCLWLGGVGIAGLAFFVNNISNHEFDAASLIPLGMFIFGYLLATGGFKFESIKAKNKLLELLDGEMER